MLLGKTRSWQNQASAKLANGQWNTESGEAGFTCNSFNNAQVEKLI
jgi:hypothetical protein